jgi:uncharacterized protein YegL
MAYDIAATSATPALVVYLLDVSGSMSEHLDGVPKIQHLNRALQNVIGKMVARSTKSEVVSPRYRLAMIAYSSTPKDILGGIRTVAEVAQLGSPQFKPTNQTDTAAAFMMARDLLRRELPSLRGHPAPLVCHMTDGAYTGSDPEPVAHEIMQMTTDDGGVLVQNIYMGADLTRSPIADVESWPGVRSEAELSNAFATKLFRMSSPIPKRYADTIEEDGFSLAPGAAMLFPASSTELVELAFAMSGATYTR